MDIASEMPFANPSSGGAVPVSAARGTAAPVLRRAGPIPATGRLLPVLLPPRSRSNVVDVSICDSRQADLPLMMPWRIDTEVYISYCLSMNLTGPLTARRHVDLRRQASALCLHGQRTRR